MHGNRTNRSVERISTWLLLPLALTAAGISEGAELQRPQAPQLRKAAISKSTSGGASRKEQEPLTDDQVNAAISEYKELYFGKGAHTEDHSQFRKGFVALQSQSRLNELAVGLNRHIAKGGDQVIATLLLADVYIKTGRRDDAKRLISTLREREPKQPFTLEYFRLEGLADLEGYDSEEAVRILTRYTARTHRAEAYTALAEALLKEHQTELAQKAIEEARKRYPSYERIKYVDALIDAAYENYAQGLNHVREYRKYAPDDAAAGMTELQLLLSLNRETEALALCRKAVGPKADEASALDMLGQAYGRIENPRRAIEAYTKCIALHPSDTGPRLRRAEEFFRVLLYDTAIDDCKIALKIDPRCNAAKDLIAKCLREKSRKGSYDEF